jgi:WD40 repeat protein
LWDLSAPERAVPIALQGHAQVLAGDIEFSSDGHWLMIGSYKQDRVLYDLTSKEPAAAPLTVHGRPVSSEGEFFFSPDGRWILGFHWDEQRVRAWKLGQQGPVFEPTRLDELPAVQALFFSGDGDYLVTGDKSSYQVWSFSDLVNEELAKVRPVFEGESGGALPYRLTADRRWLVFNDYSLVELQTSKASRLISGPTHLLLKTVVSNDARKILVASDMTSSLWYLDHLELPPVALWSRGSLMASYFSPNADWLVIPGETIYIQYLDKKTLIERACQVAGRNLTRREWQRFFAGEEYRLTCPQWPAPLVE